MSVKNIFVNCCKKCKKKPKKQNNIFLLLCKYIDMISQNWSEKKIPAY